MYSKIESNKQIIIMINKISETKFENKYPTLAAKIHFLKFFDLLNLQKASKIGKISPSKSKDRTSVIKSIISFDLKNNFLICKTIFKNPKEYGKPKIDDVQNIDTIEWNRHQFDFYTDKNWEEMINDDEPPFEIKQVEYEPNKGTVLYKNQLEPLTYTREQDITLNRANDYLQKLEKLILENKINELDLFKKQHEAHIINLRQVMDDYADREEDKISKLESINDKIEELNNILLDFQKRNVISEELLHEFRAHTGLDNHKPELKTQKQEIRKEEVKPEYKPEPKFEAPEVKETKEEFKQEQVVEKEIRKEESKKTFEDNQAKTNQAILENLNQIKNEFKNNQTKKEYEPKHVCCHPERDVKHYCKCDHTDINNAISSALPEYYHVKIECNHSLPEHCCREHEKMEYEQKEPVREYTELEKEALNFLEQKKLRSKYNKNVTSLDILEDDIRVSHVVSKTSSNHKSLNKKNR